MVCWVSLTHSRIFSRGFANWKSCSCRLEYLLISSDAPSAAEPPDNIHSQRSQIDCWMCQRTLGRWTRPQSCSQPSNLHSIAGGTVPMRCDGDHRDHGRSSQGWRCCCPVGLRRQVRPEFFDVNTCKHPTYTVAVCLIANIVGPQGVARSVTILLLRDASAGATEGFRDILQHITGLQLTICPGALVANL